MQHRHLRRKKKEKPSEYKKGSRHSRRRQDVFCNCVLTHRWVTSEAHAACPTVRSPHMRNPSGKQGKTHERERVSSRGIVQTVPGLACPLDASGALCPAVLHPSTPFFFAVSLVQRHGSSLSVELSTPLGVCCRRRCRAFAKQPARLPLSPTVTKLSAFFVLFLRTQSWRVALCRETRLLTVRYTRTSSAETEREQPELRTFLRRTHTQTHNNLSTPIYTGAPCERLDCAPGLCDGASAGQH